MIGKIARSLQSRYSRSMISELSQLVSGRALSAEQTEDVFEKFLSDRNATDAQIAAYLSFTAVRLPTSAELVGAVRCMRRHMIKVDLPGLKLLDTCGTGGSGYDSFNTSTVAALVAAAAGQPVAKHGNRAATSRCGSADILAAAGVSFDITPQEMGECLKKTGFGFFFAPAHHPATKRAGAIRRELGFRTIFNFLGPLSNPAGTQFQLLGVSNPKMVPVLAQAIAELGAERAMVVCGEDGLDEITLTGPTIAAEVSSGSVRPLTLTPEEFGLSRAPIEEILGGEPSRALELVADVLDGKPSSRRSLVELNAGAALYVAGKAATVLAGVELAREILVSGAAKRVLEQVKNETSAVRAKATA